MPDLAAHTPLVDARMRAYYDRRANEYDEWWLGTGPFAKRARPGWREEVNQVISLVASLPAARTLDVACGTGFLTRHLAGEIVGLDQSQAMVAVAAARMPSARIVHGEAVPLPFPDDAFETVFSSHFYGHLQKAERMRFLAEVRRVASRLIVVDAALRADVDGEQWQERMLNDGSRHSIYKRYFTPQQLAEELSEGTILHGGRWFVVVDCALRIPATHDDLTARANACDGAS